MTVQCVTVNVTARKIGAGVYVAAALLAGTAMGLFFVTSGKEKGIMKKEAKYK